MEAGPRLKVSSDRLVKPGNEPATPGLQGERFIHYTTAATIRPLCLLEKCQNFGPESYPTKHSGCAHGIECILSYMYVITLDVCVDLQQIVVLHVQYPWHDKIFP